MNIIRKLTQRFLRLNRTRTLVTIIGVIISTAMITAVPTLMMSFLRANRELMIKDYGNWHVRYNDISLKGVDILARDANTAWVSLFRLDGFSKLEDSKAAFKPYLVLMSMDKNCIGTYGLKLAEGRFPANESEAAISVEAMRMGGLDINIGDKLTLEVGKRFSIASEEQESVELGLDDNYNEPWEGQPETEELRLVSAEEVTVVGIIKQPSQENYFMPGFSLIRFLDRADLAENDQVSALVTWKNVTKAANKHANQLGYAFGLSDMEIEYNTNLVRTYGILSQDNLITVYLFVGVLLLVILVGSVFLISNAFSISVVERSRQLGMLASVGATKEQKKKAIYGEALIIALVAIPIGILAGIVGITMTLHLVEPIINSLTNESTVNLSVIVTPGLIVFSILFALVTIFVSAMGPARRAANVSPIEAIRQTQDIKIKGDKIRTPKLVRRIFGFEADLALKNIKRNSKGYVITILSLVVSIILFLGVYSIGQYAFGAADTQVIDFEYPVVVRVQSNASPEEIDAFYQAIGNIPEVEDTVVVQRAYGDVVMPQNSLPIEFRRDGSWVSDQLSVGEGEQPVGIRFEILKEDEYEEILKENDIVEKNSEDGSLLVILFNPMVTLNQSGKLIERPWISVETGEQFDIELGVYDSNNSSKRFEVSRMTVFAMLEKGPFDIGIGRVNLLTAFVSDKNLLQFFESLGPGLRPDVLHSERILIKTDLSEKVVKEIQDIQLAQRIGETYIENQDMYQSSTIKVQTIVSVFVYGFVTLIALIGVTNILNTILTGIRLRSREFAMLRSVGMTPGSFNKMLQFESLYFGVVALLFGLPLGMGLNYVFFVITKRAFSVRFMVPWLAIGVVIVVVLLITMMVMQLSSRQAKKANIVETLKKEMI